MANWIFDFQKKMANSQMTLPVVSVITCAVWFALPSAQSTAFADVSDYGIWMLVPEFVQQGYWGLSLGLVCAALGVYLLAELNNSNVLLRISSRMLSSMLALLLMLSACTHVVHPGGVVMVVSLLSFFTLFSSYQIDSPMLSFCTHLFVSVAALVFPKLLVLIPVYWILQSYLRAMSFRSFVASLLAVVLPFWLYVGVAVSIRHFDMFERHCLSLMQWTLPNYGAVALTDALPAIFALVLFLIGAVHFSFNSFLDKTRTRIIYNVVIMHGVSIAMFMALQPQYVAVLLPLMLADTAIVYGHFFALTYNRFSHVLNLLLIVAALAMMAFTTII